jgi:Ser/Thr protein kinase RdoA (MazF antagonist)
MVACNQKKCILQIYNKNSNVETSVQFCNYLHKKKLPVPRVIENLNAQLITPVGSLNGVLFEFCAGKRIKWNNIVPSLAEHLAKTVAKMHLLMLNNTQIPAEKCYKYKLESSVGLSNPEIIEKSKKISNATEKLAFSNFRKGLIHSDLTRQNVLATMDRKHVDAIIDFDDAHYDYIVWDLAVLITHVFITKTFGVDWKALSVFIKKYYSAFSLTKKEIDAIIPFINARNLNLAIEVNRLALEKKGNLDELRSIENSVLTKIGIVERYQERLANLLRVA